MKINSVKVGLRGFVCTVIEFALCSCVKNKSVFVIIHFSTLAVKDVFAGQETGSDTVFLPFSFPFSSLSQSGNTLVSW